MFEIKKTSLAFMPVALGMLAFHPSAASAESATINCYANADDADHDGYARIGASAVKKSVSGLACPTGYVNRNDDCDDHDSGTHPRQVEWYYNNNDDNCANGMDEPEFYPSQEGSSSATSHTIWLMSNNLLDEIGTDTGEVTYDMDIQDLADTTTTYHSARGSMQRFDAAHYWSIIYGGLSASSIRRVRVNVYLVGNRYARTGWYYFMTGSSDRTADARRKIVNRAFYEAHESDWGHVGYRGTIKKDGTRYGASSNEKWCSEFYSWITGPILANMSGQDTVDDLISYFQYYGMWVTDVTQKAWPGEYAAMDTDMDGRKNHSAVVVKYDAGKDYYWTVEGNYGNNVRVATRSLDPSLIMGTGWIKASMLR
jgi:hypothetical protein